MKKFRFFIVFLFFHITHAHDMMTYKLQGGRFGDNIFIYTKAKWIAYECNLPFLYCPFKFSSALKMHVVEKHCTAGIKRHFKQQISVKNLTDISQCRIHPTLFYSNYHTIADGNHWQNDEFLYLKSIYDPLFGEQLREMLSPISSHEVDLPKDRISIAVHIRKGSGPDRPPAQIQFFDSSSNIVSYIEEVISEPVMSKAIWATLLLPNQFYIDQIIGLSEFFHDAPMYVRIFTDGNTPNQLLHDIKLHINKPNIVVECFNKPHADIHQVVNDYWAMSQFDCLIRPSSNLSWAAQLLGEHKIIIYPLHRHWEGHKLIVDEIKIILRGHDQINMKRSWSELTFADRDMAMQSINLSHSS